jgi:hypothetical protein
MEEDRNEGKYWSIQLKEVLGLLPLELIFE